MRRGFGLITAIIILVVVSTLMTLMISLSTSSVKQTTDLYFKEQAELLARSAVEYGLLAISGHENNVSCIENINITYGNTHEANLTLYYIYAKSYTTLPTCSSAHVLATNIDTNKSNLTTMIDVRVSVNQATTGISEPIVIQRRTIQKP
jgi:hypothetical protein